jgi:predicted dehydrogenase
MKEIKWGIYGPGGIAKRFAEAMQIVPNAYIHAVAGRTYQKAETFAKTHHIPNVLPDIHSLADNADVDAVYVATTHNIHCSATCINLKAGKAVLCEKPLAMNAQEVTRMIEASQKNSAFLMEALWTRFLPVWQRVRQLISDGAIGELKLLQANFGTTGDFNKDGRMLNKALAGGALLDLGIYPVSMAQMLFNSPIESIQAVGAIGETGVDMHTAMQLESEGGCIAQLSASLCSNTKNHFMIAGTQGQIEVLAPFWGGTEINWKTIGKELQHESFPHRKNGFEEQIEEVNQCIREAKLESKVMPHKDSLEIAHTLDEIRRQIGLQYPADEKPAEPCGS